MRVILGLDPHTCLPMQLVRHHGGKFSDIWGRKPVLLIAAAIFFIGSLLAAVSVSIAMLIAARAIQGIGGGGVDYSG
jgi:MFS family permease